MALKKKKGVIQKSNFKNGNYGVDAPSVIRNLLLGSISSIVAGITLRYLLESIQTSVGLILLIWGIISGASMFLTAVLMLWSSKLGKIKFREKLIDSLELQGTEIVLDVGCGRGLLLNAVARRLKTGKAIGIDIWQNVDQSGNSPEAALKNARIEGVEDNIEVITGDMRALPFENQSFDVVVSNLAIHNLPTPADRTQAILEINRVLKPQGKLVLVDFRFTNEYVQTLQKLGWNEVKRSGLQFLIFPPVRVITGKKPNP